MDARPDAAACCNIPLWEIHSEVWLHTLHSLALRCPIPCHRGAPPNSPHPHAKILRGPEEAEAFLARWQRSLDEFERGTKGIKHGADGARDPGAGTGAALPGSGKLDWRGPFDRVPVDQPELEGHILAPELPPEADALYELIQRCAFVIRRRAWGGGPAWVWRRPCRVMLTQQGPAARGAQLSDAESPSRGAPSLGGGPATHSLWVHGSWSRAKLSTGPPAEACCPPPPTAHCGSWRGEASWSRI